MTDGAPVVDGPRVDGGLVIRCVTDSEALASSAAAWDRLVRGRINALPFNTYAWVSAFVEHRLRPGESWACIQAWRGGDLLGVLPLTLRRARLLGCVRTIASTPFDDHTQFSSILTSQGTEDVVVPALLAEAVRLTPGLAMVELQGLRAESPRPQESLRSQWRQLEVPSDEGGFLPIGSDFAAYRASLSRRLRSNLNRATRKLVGHADVAFECTHGGDASTDALEEFMAVEAAGWKGASGTAIACSEDLVRFYATLTRRLAASGWLEWQTLRVDGRAIASALAVAMGARIFLVKVGFRPEFADLSPGMLLVERVIERAFADGLNEVDFLTNPPWIQPWQLQARTSEYVRLYPRRTREGLVAYGLHRLARIMKGLPLVVPFGRKVRRVLRRQPVEGDHVR